MSGMDEDMVAAARRYAAGIVGGAAVADADLVARGVHPVSVAHGDAETAEDAELIYDRLPALARQSGDAPVRRGGNDYSIYYFTGPGAADSAVAFIAAVSEIARPWWRITASAQPRFGAG